MSNADPYIPTVSGNLGMVDKEFVGDDGVSRGPPLSANLSGLGVIPAAAPLLVIHDHERAIAELVSARRNHHTVVVAGDREIPAGDFGTCHERWLRATGRGVE